LPPSRLTLGLRSLDTDRFRSPDTDLWRSLNGGDRDAEPSRFTRGLRSPETDLLRSFLLGEGDRLRLGDAERLRRASRDRLRRRGDGDLHMRVHKCTSACLRGKGREERGESQGDGGCSSEGGSRGAQL
jgi:hypothetical protein